MKKKHERSLQSIKKWLDSQITLSEDLSEAFQKIQNVLGALPEAEDISVDRPLPPPSEIQDEPRTLALYSDGGCRGNPGPGAFAFVVQDHSGHVVLEGVEFEDLTTNNKMELSGPISGLRELQTVLPEKGMDPLLTKIKVLTDSKYVVDGMKSWVAGWKSRGWKKADNKTPENLELWQELDVLKNSFMQVEWVWVKGHAGHPQNEYCDRKANEVMDARLS
jgi:ribonuclease HI